MTSATSVLVVDDDYDVRDSLAEALMEEGFNVSVAENGKVALERLLSGARPDVILLDIMMPEMDGWAFRAEQLRHDDIASIPIVVFTAYGAPLDTARRIGAEAYLEKPLRLVDLVSTINRFGLRGSAQDSTYP